MEPVVRQTCGKPEIVSAFSITKQPQHSCHSSLLAGSKGTPLVQAGKTKLSMQMLFKTAEERDQVVEKYGAVEGLKQNMDKLGEYLAKV
jgi:hypothetical protein